MKKKQSFSSTFVWLKDVGLKVFAVLALIIGGFYVYAEISWPTDQPNSTSGVVGMFVGESNGGGNDHSDFDETNNQGYAMVNTLCANSAGDVANSHICTPDEMANSYNHGNAQSAIHTYLTTFTGASKMLWINNGPPGYTANANDCGGWKKIDGGSGENPNFGAVWNFQANAGGLTPCKVGKKFACCK
jgi:hypothetical protein